MIPYIGGKSYLASWIISNFPEDYPKLTYCEVFGGGGWVLFKKEQSFVEIYNDLNKDLVNLFTTIRDNYPEFSHRAEWCLHSREMFKEAIEKLADDEFISSVEKAMHYAILRVQTFAGGNSKSWAYGITADKITSGKWLPFIKRLELINARLKRVQIECLDFGNIIERYDRKSTLFYLDPPYVDAEHYYNTKGVNFGSEDHIRLAKLLKRIKGKFVLSYYEHPEVRKLYKGYRIITKNTVKHSCGITKYSTISEKPKSVELLIMNY
jgi:DNA adenine methylase